MARAEGRTTPTDGSAAGSGVSAVLHESPSAGLQSDAIVGSPEHLRLHFGRAAAAADRAVGLWLARSIPPLPDDLPESSRERSAGELRALRAMVRASTTAYVRRLRDEGATPERMLVLVKAAAGTRGSSGFGVQELTNDVVRWSIEAYFGE